MAERSSASTHEARTAATPSTGKPVQAMSASRDTCAPLGDAIQKLRAIGDEPRAG